MVLLLITIEAQPTKCGELEQTLRLLVGQVREEPGCLTSHVYRDVEQSRSCVSSGCGRLRQTWMRTCKQIIGRYWVERRSCWAERRRFSGVASCEPLGKPEQAGLERITTRKGCSWIPR